MNKHPLWNPSTTLFVTILPKQSITLILSWKPGIHAYFLPTSTTKLKSLQVIVFSGPLRMQESLCYTPGVIVRVCVRVYLPHCPLVLVLGSVSVLVCICGQANQC